MNAAPSSALDRGRFVLVVARESCHRSSLVRNFEQSAARWVIYLTLGFALGVMLLPISIEWRSLRPDIASLALFYWVLACPIGWA
ncbi:MAG: hypothetical protein CM15mP74_00640 [Halieaceae bacterium]|nr:MAG: hypothetical protein CM15mP74_00640 [Halieaceae bacterium]